jgi:death-on-curing protein
MEDFGREVVYPTVEQICEVNRRMIEEFGGLFIPPDNLFNLGALEYALDAIKSCVFGHTMYPTLKQKANAIAYQIISRHVFHDGNKRTAIHIAWEFLRSNGTSLFLNSSIIELSVAISAGESSQEELLEWLHEHQEN